MLSLKNAIDTMAKRQEETTTSLHKILDTLTCHDGACPRPLSLTTSMPSHMFSELVPPQQLSVSTCPIQVDNILSPPVGTRGSDVTKKRKGKERERERKRKGKEIEKERKRKGKERLKER